MTRNTRVWLKSVFTFLSVLALTGAGTTSVVLGSQSVYQWMQSAPTFAVSDVAVIGADVASKSEIIALSGVARGENIFRTDLIAAQTRLEHDRRFENVFVRRILPNHIEIYLRERKPIALVQLDQLYGVDYDGQIVPAPPLERLSNLPVVTGILSEKSSLIQAVVDGKTTFQALSDSILLNARVDRALYVIEMIRTFAPEFVNQISEVNVALAHDPIIYTTANSTAVRLGIGHYPGKIKRLNQIFERLKQDKIDTRWIDLRFDGQVVVRPIFTADNSDSSKS